MTRDNPDNLSISRKCGIGDDAHQPDVTAAIDKPDTIFGECLSEGLGRVNMRGVRWHPRAAVNAKGRYFGHRSDYIGKIRNMRNIFAVIVCCFPILASSSVFAGEADVTDVKVVKVDADVFRFSVTVRHADEGWEHYADRWEVLDMNGNSLGSRVLMHPHVNEQPFTRSMTLSLPMNVKEVRVRAHDKLHEYGGEEMVVAVPD